MSRTVNNNAPITLVGLHKEIQLPLIDKEILSHDSRRYRFALNSGHRLGLPIGNHISVRANINGNLLQRSYTPVSSDDDLGYVDLVIKVYFPNEQFPVGGAMTQHIENLNIGDKLTFVGPKGRIHYRNDGEFNITLGLGTTSTVTGIKNIGMIAGGSGITPMLQVVRDALKHKNETAKIWLLYANKTIDDILLRDEIEQINQDNGNRFSVMYTVDKPLTQLGDSKDWHYQTGHITKEMIEQYLPKAADNTMTLICGPPGMINFACLPNLATLGHKDDRIFVY